MPAIQNTGRAEADQVRDIAMNINVALNEYIAGHIQGGHLLAILWTQAVVHAQKVVPNDDPAQLALIMRPELARLMANMIDVTALHRTMRELGYTTNGQTAELICFFIASLKGQP